MSLARLVVTAVRIEGRTKAEVSRDYGVSPRWVYELCRRIDAEGEAGLEPRSRRPRASPQRIRWRSRPMLTPRMSDRIPVD
jgi:transposase